MTITEEDGEQYICIGHHDGSVLVSKLEDKWEKRKDAPFIKVSNCLFF